ncbi:MAG: hypothetical protein AAF726_06515 [Planctomycetota bacterium]
MAELHRLDTDHAHRTNDAHEPTRRRLVRSLGVPLLLVATFPSVDPIRGPSDDLPPTGRARLEIEVLGAPPTELLEDGEAPAFLCALSALDRNSTEIARVDLVEGNGRWARTVELPSDTDMELFFRGNGRPRAFRESTFRLTDRSTERIEIDLGYPKTVEARIAGVPCATVDGIRVTAWASGEVRFPDGHAEDIDVSVTAVANANGVLHVPDPRARGIRWNATGTLGPLHATGEVDEDGRVLLRSEQSWVVLHSKPGTSVAVGPESSAIPIEWHAGGDVWPAHVAAVAPVFSDRFRVFVDGVSRGVVDRNALRSVEPRCWHVDDLETEDDLARIDVTLTNVEADDVELIVSRAEDIGLYARDQWSTRFGAITPNGDRPSNAATLGSWTRQPGGELTATMRLPRGTYWLGVALDGRREIASLRPLVVADTKRQGLRFDISATDVFAVELLDSAGMDLDFHSRPRGLSIAGTAFVSFAQTGPVTIETFGGAPTTGRLVGAPGAVRWSVPLEAANEAEDSLVAVVPRATLVFASIERVVQGRVGGESDQSPEPEHWGDRLVSGHMSLSVDGFPDDQVGVYVRGERATGVITETIRGSALIRDWFVATRSELRLLAGGAGRYVEVESQLDVDVTVWLVPRPVPETRLRPARTRPIAAHRTRRVWIPASAAGLEWRNGDERLGSIELSDSEDRIVIR